MLRSFALLLSLLVSFASCGTETSVDSSNVPTGSLPLVLEIKPDTASTGTVVTVSGLGYSIVPQENIIHFGDTSVLAESYDIVPGREELTFTVPSDAATGSHNLLITVLEEPSNADMIFTVTP